MIIQKFHQFVNENLQDTPEEYIKTCLLQIKNKIDKIFQKAKDEPGTDINGAKNRWKEKNKKASEMSLRDLKVNLESSEISTFSSLNDNVVIKFTDEGFLYDLTIFIPLENGIPKNKEDFSSQDIKNCSVKFKKYELDSLDLIGQIGPKKVEIKDISEEFLVNLKLELDGQFGEEETLEIETNPD